MNLSELFETWQRWNSRDVAETAARQAEAAGNEHGAAVLRRGLDHDAPTAIEALAAQHEVAELLAGWRWHTVAAAREQGASWQDIAEATHTMPTVRASEAQIAREVFRGQVARAEHAAEHYGVPFRDADRYHFAARDDTTTTSTQHDERSQVRDQDEDGAGDRASNGSEDDDEDDGDDDMALSDRFGAGPRERAAQERLDRAQGEDCPHSLVPAGALCEAVDDAREIDRGQRPDLATAAELTARAADADHRSRVEYPDVEYGGVGYGGVEHIAGPDLLDDGVVVGEIALPGGLPPDDEDGEDAEFGFAAPGTWVESEEGRAHLARWAAETADPAAAEQAGPRDDPDELTRRLDEARLRLTGYTWRDGVDRDEAIAARLEQLAHWHNDDHATGEAAALVDDGDGGTS